MMLTLSPAIYDNLLFPFYPNPAKWAEKNRVLTSAYSSRPGKWSNNYAPYLTGIHEAIGQIGIKRVVLMMAAQVGKSETILNTLGWAMDCDPASIMLIQPTEQSCREWSKGRLHDLMSSCTSLNKKVFGKGPARQTTTALEVHYQGGVLYIAHSNSATALSSKTIKLVLMDEIDKYPNSIKGEGNPILLAEQRTVTFTDSMVLMVSTPSIAGLSKIERYYKQGDMRRWFCECVSCGHTWCWTWSDVKFGNRKPASARLLCTECGVMHNQYEVNRMSRSGRWLATTDKPERDDTVSFTIWAIHSPVITMAALVRKFLSAKDSVDDLQVFVNASLAETFELSLDFIDYDDIIKKQGVYSSSLMPAGVLLLTMSVDIQSNRFEYYIAGWGEGETHFGIEHGVVKGDISSSDTMAALVDVAAHKSFATEDGRMLKVAGVGIDLGYGQDTAAEVLQAINRKIHSRGGMVFGIRGSADVVAPVISKRYRFLAKNKRSTRTPTYHNSWFVGTNRIKDVLQSRFKLDDGHGSWSWASNFDEPFFKQLVSERKVLRKTGGKFRGVWEKKTTGGKNEAFDLSVYAYAILKLMKPDWAALLSGRKKPPVTARIKSPPLSDDNLKEHAINLPITVDEVEEPVNKTVKVPQKAYSRQRVAGIKAMRLARG